MQFHPEAQQSPSATLCLWVVAVGAAANRSSEDADTGMRHRRVVHRGTLQRKTSSLSPVANVSK